MPNLRRLMMNGGDEEGVLGAPRMRMPDDIQGPAYPDVGGPTFPPPGDIGGPVHPDPVPDDVIIGGGPEQGGGGDEIGPDTRSKEKPRDLFDADQPATTSKLRPPAIPMGSNTPSGGSDSQATPQQSPTPSPTAAQPPMQQYLTPPSVMRPNAPPVVLPQPPAQSLVNPIGGQGRMFGKAEGQLGGGFGLPDQGHGAGVPSDLLLMLAKLLGGQ